MKELDNFTVERLEELVKLQGGEIQALARIALAAKTAEPVGSFHIYEGQVDGTTDYVKDGEWPIDTGELLVYTAPVLNSPELPDGWIKCSERMPECGQWDHAAVIVSEGNNSFIAYYNKRGGKFLDEPFGMSVGNKVTHWQPLPAPPTTEK